MKFSVASLTAALGSFAYMRFWEPGQFELTEKTVVTGKAPGGLRVLHLSDLHASPEVPYAMIEEAVDMALAAGADVAVLTGDFITWDLQGREEYVRILQKISQRMPAFACVGNHDGGAWSARTRGYQDFSKVAEVLQVGDVRLLFNQWQRLSVRGIPLRICGMGDWWSNDCRPEEVLSLDGEGEVEELTLVMSHNPDSKTKLLHYQWDLMLCGHTHGGQLVIPFLDLRPFLPVEDTSFAEGLLKVGSKHIHITRGVGNVHGMRFNCRPEVSLLNLI